MNINSLFRYYVKDIETIVNQFVIPLKDSNLLSKQEIEDLFGNVELICKVNKELLSLLIHEYQAAGNIQLMNVGQQFIKMVRS
jgi:hypothetical protein